MSSESHSLESAQVQSESNPSNIEGDALDRAAVLHIVRNSLDVAPVNDAEIARATQLRGSSGTLLAAIAIDHMLAASQPAEDESSVESGFGAYYRYAIVTEKLEGVTGQQPILLDGIRRQELQKVYKTEQADARKKAAGFIALLDVVSGLANEFDEAHAAAKNRLDWLGDLADRAETTGSPLLKALPPVASYGRRYPSRRDSITQAGRLLWYTIVQADEVTQQGV